MTKKKFCVLWFTIYSFIYFFFKFSVYLMFNQSIFVKKRLKMSLEPDSNQWPKDVCTFLLQSSALPTELSRGWGFWEQFTEFQYFWMGHCIFPSNSWQHCLIKEMVVSQQKLMTWVPPIDGDESKKCES